MMKINKHFEYRMRRARFVAALATMALLLGTLASVMAQTTALTYQGKLTDNGNPANGNYDFQFKLFDTPTVGTGTQQGSMVMVPNVTVTSGIFTVQLDFGAGVFAGADRFLEIAVKQTSASTFTTLGPRQPLTATPYTVRSLNAAAADGLSPACLNCVTSSQIQSVQGSQVTGNIAGSQINGAIPVASVPPGSGDYIQNTTSQQADTNFNISGSGTAAGTLSASALSGFTVNATLDYRIGGSRAFVADIHNVFAGLDAGTANTGNQNAFLGFRAGMNNVSGARNSFIGEQAGLLNTLGSRNSFFGSAAGANNNGSDNVFVGRDAANTNTSGLRNTIIGSLAQVGSSSLVNATALGSQALVTTRDSLVLDTKPRARTRATSFVISASSETRGAGCSFARL